MLEIEQFINMLERAKIPFERKESASERADVHEDVIVYDGSGYEMAFGFSRSGYLVEVESA